MIKNYTYLILFSLLFFTTNSIAQTTEGCDGSRYFFNVFDDVTMSTVKYGENITAAGNMQELFMDVYEPIGDMNSKRPLVIFAFGGGFVGGERQTMEDFCIDYAKKGYVAATIDYRLWNVFAQGIPDSLEMFENAVRAVSDLRGAVRYFRRDADNGNIFKIDPDFIFAGGISAGAFAALHAACIDEDDVFPDYAQEIIDRNGGIEGNTGDAMNLQYSSSIQAVINMSGALHIKDWLDADDPPFVSFHGTADEVVPYNFGQVVLFGMEFLSVYGSGELNARADDIGVDNYIYTVQGGMHENIYIDNAYLSDREEFYLFGNNFLHNILCNNFILDTDDPESLSQMIQVFPNPANHAMTLSVGAITVAYDVRIYDQLGRLVKNYNNQRDPQLELLKEEIGSGIYFAEIHFRDQNFPPVVKKLLFQ